MPNDDNIPWKTLPSDLGPVPFYVIQFDKHGKCTSPAALDHLVETSRAKTDVFLFSHGWNNDWAAATSRYDRFVQQFVDVRRDKWNPPTRPFAPVLAGVFWPSAALVAPWEKGPDIAAGADLDPDIATLADELAPEQRDAFLQIMSNPSADDTATLAELLAPVVGSGAEEIGSSDRPVRPDELLEAWHAISAQQSNKVVRPGGFIDDVPGPVGAPVQDPAVAGGWNPLQLIRDGLRATTVLLMKDRAGRVGGNGVADMLRRLADAGQARISLIGHSYGAKVVLSALCNGDGPRRPVDSVLLLQPALSCYAFTTNLDGRPGGYRPAFQRSRLPIITTYSANDQPLTKFFQLAVRRKSDIAEAVIAAGEPPSKFCALGGYGPHGVGVDASTDWLTMPDTGIAYPTVANECRIIAVDGTPYITGHGHVEIPQTAWALLTQVRG
jgi:hypothetical protein